MASRAIVLAALGALVLPGFAFADAGQAFRFEGDVAARLHIVLPSETELRFVAVTVWHGEDADFGVFQGVHGPRGPFGDALLGQVTTQFGSARGSLGVADVRVTPDDSEAIAFRSAADIAPLGNGRFYTLLNDALGVGLETDSVFPPGSYDVVLAAASSRSAEWTIFDYSGPPASWEFTRNTGLVSSKTMGGAAVTADFVGPDLAVVRGEARLPMDRGFWGLSQFLAGGAGVDYHRFQFEGPDSAGPADNQWFYGRSPGTYRFQLDEATAGVGAAKSMIAYADFPVPTG